VLTDYEGSKLSRDGATKTFKEKISREIIL
jgi:hypothetical protein